MCNLIYVDIKVYSRLNFIQVLVKHTYNNPNPTP